MRRARGRPPDYIKRFWLLDGLDEFLKASDVVMVTVPITPESRGMISAARLGLMKQGLVSDRRLARRYRRRGRAAGASWSQDISPGLGLDATDPEPLPADSPLWDAPNMIITPHTSGWSTQTNAAVVEVFKENLRRFVAGQPLFTPVNKKLGY